MKQIFKNIIGVACSIAVFGVVVIFMFAAGIKPFELKTTAPGDNVAVYNSGSMLWTGYALDALAKVSDIPTNNNQLTNGAGYITSVPAQTWLSITGKPILFSGSYPDLTNKPTIDNYTDTRARASISLTTTGNTGVSTYNAATGVLNVPNYSFTPTAPNYSNTPARTLNAAGSILSATKPTWVSYSITHTVALTLVTLNGASNVYLEISPNNTTWTTISQAGFSDGVAVAVAITKNQTNNIQGYIPANYYYRIRSVVTGGGSATFANGQEVTIN